MAASLRIEMVCLPHPPFEGGQRCGVKPKNDCYKDCRSFLNPKNSSLGASKVMSWRKIESTSHPGLYYYYNTDTKESTWSLPKQYKSKNAPLKVGEVLLYK